MRLSLTHRNCKDTPRLLWKLRESPQEYFPVDSSVSCWEDYEIQKDIYLLSLVNVCERSNLTVFVGTKDFAQGAGWHFTVQTIDVNPLLFMLFAHWLVTLPFGSAKESNFKTNLDPHEFLVTTLRVSARHRIRL